MKASLNRTALAVAQAWAWLAVSGCGGGDSALQTPQPQPQSGRVSVLSDATPAPWMKIATESQSFTVDGTQTVRYGTGSSWVQKDVTNSGQCTNAFFGNDP